MPSVSIIAPSVVTTAAPMFGPHVGKRHAHKKASMAEHAASAVADAKQHGLAVGAIQVFVSSPRKLELVMSANEAAGVKEWATRARVRVVAHSTYAAPPWENKFAARFVSQELRRCRDGGFEGLVVHLPHAKPALVPPAVKAIVALYEDKEKYPAKDMPKLFLETPAAVTERHYETPEKLKVLFDSLGDVKQHVGLCVDTAHLWTCGVDLSDREGAQHWLEQLQQLLPATAVMLHLNDSHCALGRGPDSHAALGAGEMWRGRRLQHSGLGAFVDFAVKHNCIAILERSSPVSSDYAAVAALAPSVRAVRAGRACVAAHGDARATATCERVGGTAVVSLTDEELESVMALLGS